MSKQEILPPLRSLPATQNQATGPTIIPTRVQPGGIINSTLMRWEADRHARTITAVTGKTKAETDLFDAQALLVDAFRRRQQAVEHLRELPEIIESERAKRRSVHAEELRQVQHKHEVAEVNRMTEIARVETVLVDAQQALRAQREFGYTVRTRMEKKELRDAGHRTECCRTSCHPSPAYDAIRRAAGATRALRSQPR